MSTLLLKLVGPMQSWGTTSRFDERDSQLEPSKSGVLGLICAALGRDRSEPVNDLASLLMGVRVDREGVLMRDYQTAGGNRDPKKKTMLLASGKATNRTVVSHRYYLSDAAFLVGLEGNSDDLLQQIHDALRAPVWPLALGRKSFPPGEPVWIKGGIREEGLRAALLDWPRISLPRHGQNDELLRIVMEHANEGAVRLDQPVAPFSERQFGPRYIVSETAHVPV